jgi:hypothetical protein
VTPNAQAVVKPPEEKTLCEQSLAGLTKRPDLYAQRWRSALGEIHDEMLAPDLVGLFKHFPRLRKDPEPNELVTQGIYFLNCLEKEGALTLKKTGTTGRFWGVDFDNQLILFSPS